MQRGIDNNHTRNRFHGLNFKHYHAEVNGGGTKTASQSIKAICWKLEAMSVNEWKIERKTFLLKFTPDDEDIRKDCGNDKHLKKRQQKDSQNFTSEGKNF